MNIFFRILLTIYAFCLALISAAVMLITIRTDYFASITGFLQSEIFTDSVQGPRIAVFIAAFVFFILSLAFLFSGVRTNKDKKAVSKHTNIGEIRISLNSIENIALTASRRVNGVRDTKAYVKRIEDTVDITVRIVVMPDTGIPAISMEIQDRVKRTVEENAGIAVESVKVLVDSIYSGNNAIKA